MVVAVVAILTAAMLPWVESTQHDTLMAAAQSVATDLAYARSLAVAHNSTYSVTFYPTENRYILQHTGTDHALDVLPDTIFRDPKDPADQHIVDLAQLPAVGKPAQLLGAYRAGPSAETISSIEFGPLGETTTTTYSAVIVCVGTGSSRRHAAVLVNPITGLATVHPYFQDVPNDALSALTGG